MATVALLCSGLALAAPIPIEASPLVARDLGGARVETTMLALAAAEGGELAMAVLAVPVPAADGPNVLLVAELDGRQLARGSQDGSLALELALYALREDGSVGAFLADGVRIPAASGPTEGVRYLAGLTLPPGRHALRLLVRQRPGGAFALRTARLVLPPPGSTPSNEAPATAEPALDRRRVAMVYSAQLPTPPTPALAALLADPPLPATLASPAMTAASPESSAPATPTPRSARPGRRENAAGSSFASAYRAVLTQLAAGEREAAQAALAVAEQQLVAADPRGAADLIRTLSRAELDRLARLDPEALLPVAALHERRFFSTLAARRPGTGLLGLDVAIHAIARYASSARTDEARGLASTLYLGTAARLLEVGALERAGELADAAEGLVPGHPTALLLEAYAAERGARRDQAGKVLDRLLEAHPEHAEARLRRAVIAARQGDDRRAEMGLRALLAGTTQPWIEVVASQELARLLLSSGRTQEAVALLDEASVRHGATAPSLAIASAWALGHQGKHREARARINALSPPPPLGFESPRRRYGSWPEDALGKERRRSEEAALLRVAALRAALARLPLLVG